MGRKKNEVPTGKYKIRHHEGNNSAKQYPIQIEYIWNREAVRKNDGLRVCDKDWDPKGNGGIGGLKASFGSEYGRENKRLKQKIDDIDAKLRLYNDEHPGQVTIEVIKALLDNKPIMRKDKGKDFAKLVEERIEARYVTKQIGISRKQNGISGMNGFAEFLKTKGKGTYKPDGIYVSEVSPELIKDYITWRRDIKGNQDSTINHSIEPIIYTCEYAADMGYIDRAVYNHIKELRIKTGKSVIDDTEEKDIKYLTKEQMAKLIKFYEEDVEIRRKEYIEMFLFAFFACGLRLVDIMTLKWRHIDFKNKLITKIQVKTRNRNQIPLNDNALEILKMWQKKERRKEFVFDLVPDSLNVSDTETLYKVRNTATRSINQSLNVVGEKIGLPFNLSMHKARHTFAVWALNQGTDMTVVSRLLGHETSDVTEKIYAIFLKSTLSEQVSKLNLGSLPSTMADK